MSIVIHECAPRRSAIVLNPQYYCAWLFEGQSRAFLKDKVGAISCFRKALEVLPNDANALSRRPRGFRLLRRRAVLNVVWWCYHFSAVRR